MWIQTLAVSSAERVKAVHENFAGRTGADMLNVLMVVAVATVALFALLVIANYAQQRGRERREAEHRAELEAKLSTGQPHPPRT